MAYTEPYQYSQEECENIANTPWPALLLDLNNIPIYKEKQTVLTDEMREKFLESGILARPISQTEYLLTYPNNTTIIMKGRS